MYTTLFLSGHFIIISIHLKIQNRIRKQRYKNKRISKRFAVPWQQNLLYLVFDICSMCLSNSYIFHSSNKGKVRWFIHIHNKWI